MNMRTAICSQSAKVVASMWPDEDDSRKRVMSKASIDEVSSPGRPCWFSAEDSIIQYSTAREIEPCLRHTLAILGLLVCQRTLRSPPAPRAAPRMQTGRGARAAGARAGDRARRVRS